MMSPFLMAVTATDSVFIGRVSHTKMNRPDGPTPAHIFRCPMAQLLPEQAVSVSAFVRVSSAVDPTSANG